MRSGRIAQSPPSAKLRELYDGGCEGLYGGIRGSRESPPIQHGRTGWPVNDDGFRHVVGLDEDDDRVVGVSQLARGQLGDGGLGHGGLASVEVPASDATANRDRPMGGPTRLDGLQFFARRVCPYPARAAGDSPGKCF